MNLIVPRQSAIVYPGGWRNPGFDPRHRAAVGMTKGVGVSAVATGGNFISLLSAQKFTVNGAPTAKITPFGPAVSFLSSGQSCTLAGQSTATPSGVTHAAIFSINTVSGTKQFAISASGSVGGTGITQYLSIFALFGQTGNIIVGSPTFGPVSGRTYFVACSATNASAGIVVVDLTTGRLYSANTSSPGDVLDTQAGTTWFGNWFLSTSHNLGGPLCAAMYNPRFTSFDDLLVWAADPWSFWYPPSGLELLNAGVGGRSGHLYRRTLSGLGTRVGARQAG